MTHTVKARTRDAVLLSAAVVAAALAVPALPPLGLPLAALPMALLCYSGLQALALLAALAGAAAATFAYGPVYGALTALLLLAAGPLATRLLRTRRVWQVVAVLSAVAFVAIVGAEAARSSMAGSDLVTDMRKQIEGVSSLWAQTMARSLPEGQTDASFVEDLRREAVAMGMRTWPGTYALIAGLTALLSVRAAAFAGRKRGADIRTPAPLAEVDLPWHVVWGVIAAFALLAYAAWARAPGGWASMAGTNAMIVCGTLLVVQGAAVSSGLYRKLEAMQNSLALRVTLVAGLVAMVILGPPLLVVLLAVVGGADLWLNFRRLPREGGERPPSPTEPTPGQGLD